MDSQGPHATQSGGVPLLEGWGLDQVECHVVSGAMEIAHEPGPDALQDHDTYMGLVDEVVERG